jgi:hypothetical protein
VTTPELSARAVAPVVPTLKALGYRKRRANFNRIVDDGITHVVSYQRSMYDPSSFTINLGIHVPPMSRYHAEHRDWYQETGCQFRWRIGEVIGDGEDQWWSAELDTDVHEAAGELLGPGLALLGRYLNFTSILTAYEAGGRESIGVWAAADLDFVDLYAATGRNDLAARLLDQEIAKAAASGDSPWVEAVNQYLSMRGKPELAIDLG